MYDFSIFITLMILFLRFVLEKINMGNHALGPCIDWAGFSDFPQKSPPH